MLTGPVPGTKLVLCGATPMACAKILSCPRRVVVAISGCTEVDDPLLAIGTSLHHLLLSRSITLDGRVATHVGLISQGLLVCLFTILHPT